MTATDRITRAADDSAMGKLYWSVVVEGKDTIANAIHGPFLTDSQSTARGFLKRIGRGRVVRVMVKIVENETR